MSFALPPVFATLQVPLILLTNILCLALGPRHQILQFGIGLPVLGLLVAQSLYREWEKGWGLHYGLNCFVMSSVFVWVEWVALAKPDQEGWVRTTRGEGKEGEKSNGNLEGNGVARSNGHAMSNGHASRNGSTAHASEKKTAPEGFLSRLWWATRLATTTRYIGWSCESKNVPVEVGPEYPRWKFIARKALRAGFFYILRDALYSYTAASPHGTWLDIAHLDPVVSFEEHPFLYRFKFTWVYVVLTYVCLELMNTLYGIVSVATGLAAPIDCPSMFGDLTGAYNVRRAWSVVWHQQVRHICSAPSTYLVKDVLKLRKGSFGSKYLQLFLCFGVSGIMHGVASMLCHASLNDDGAMKAFLLQAVIIMIEDHLIALGKRCGIKDSAFWRIVGFGWTALAIGASLEAWTGRNLAHGLWVHDREADIFGIGPK